MEEKENNNDILDLDLFCIILVIIALAIFIGLGYFIGWYKYSSKLNDYEIKVKDLTEQLSEYTITDDMLLPCPWCGSENVTIIENDLDGMYVQCEHCYAQGPSLLEYNEDRTDFKWDYEIETRQEAMEYWNNLERGK